MNSFIMSLLQIDECNNSYKELIIEAYLYLAAKQQASSNTNKVMSTNSSVGSPT